MGTKNLHLKNLAPWTHHLEELGVKQEELPRCMWGDSVQRPDVSSTFESLLNVEGK